MSKKVKSLIIGLVIIAVLCGALALLLFLPKENETPDSSSSVSSTTTIKITDFSVEKINKVTVKNKVDTFSVDRIKAADKDKSDSYQIDKLKNFKQSDTVFAYLFSTAASITASDIVEKNPTDVAKFGLDKPTAVVTINVEGGNSVIVNIGNEAKGVGGRYVSIEGKPEVYLASTNLENYLLPAKDFVDKQLTPAFPSEEQTPMMNRFEMAGGAQGEHPIVITPSKESVESKAPHTQTAYQLIAPVKADMNSDVALPKFLSLFYGMQAESVHAINPTAKDKTDCGFDKPSATVKFEYIDADGKVQTVALTVGAKKDSGYFIMVDGIDAIFVIGQETSAFMNMKWNDMILKLIHYPNISTIDTISATFEGKVYDFKLTHKKDEDGDLDVETVTYNGKNQDVENFRKLYQVFIGATAEEPSIGIKNPQGEVLLRYTYKYTDGKTDTIEFISDGNRMAYISKNGEINFKIRETYVNKFKTELNKFLNGEKVSTDW